MKRVLYIILLQIIGFSQGLHPNRWNLYKGETGDTGEPLFLTPYIDNDQIAEGKRLARVPLTDTIGVESYAGYFTVNKTFDSNQFFWYFPSMSANKDKAPVLVWLQGGPGASSLFGQFMAHGPISIKNNTFERRELHWAQNHHVIYIDNPVGTGFSFTKHPEGYCSDETQVGEQLYSTVTQFFKLFPELQQNEFYVVGESYGGKFASALAYNIHINNPTAETKINLKGFAVGNGLCDPERQFIYSTYLYQIGLIDWNAAATMAEYESEMVYYIKNQHWEDLIDSKSYFSNVTGFNTYFNYLHTEDYGDGDDYGPMLQKSDVRKEIHVGNLPFNDLSSTVETHLKQDVMQSVAPWMSELLDVYDCAIYNGQLDIIVAYPFTVNYLRNLNFSGAEEYKTAKRYIWDVDGEIAGYVKEAGKLVKILVRSAGHMVPVDQPKRAWDMITRFTHKISYHN